MPQEAANVMTTNVMTPYEMIATVIAILALLQPWIIKLWDRFGRKIRVNFIPSAKIKEWLPAKYFFEYLFFFRLQAFKELYYAFSAILSHMNEPATKETDNQCNKKTTNLRE